ncbi:MAG: S8 family serine peptidase [Desulfobacteraceae bacterium]|jgi:subtilisin family serine protease|nr:S8 family serine peptidase [Desulfobacteraceae bacterium]
MKKIPSVIAILIFCLIAVITTPHLCFSDEIIEKDYVPNEVLVRFHDWVDEKDKAAIRGQLSARLIKTIKSIQVEYWRLPETEFTKEAIEYLRKMPEIESAEPNYLYKPKALPNDPEFSKLWYLKNNGQNVGGVAGTAGADIAATTAWDIEKGSKDIIIAVIDSGVAFDHPDLINNTWKNPNEIPNNGIDDDNNGYIDDIHGWDFVNDDANPSDYSKDVYGNGHGTHVAGIIAAKGNNGVGITGVMWNAQIMPLQVFDLFEASTFYESIIQEINLLSAIEYAVINGANIINLSLGSTSFIQYEYNILNYANSNGVLVIASAGNENKNNDVSPSYPASYDLPNIISVAATNEKDELAAYSNYGTTSVDIAAPGGNYVYPNIYSTAPPEREILFYDDFESGGDKWVNGGTGLNGWYRPWSIAYDPLFRSNVAMDSFGNYFNFETSYMQTAKPINITNCRGLHFQFYINHALEYGHDFLRLESSIDGINYIATDILFTGFSNGIQRYLEWGGSEFNLDKFYLRFNLKADNINPYDGVSIDDIFITGIPWEFDGSEYGFKSGTSMAAPVVTGVAGLVWSYNPSLTHLEVKDIILNSVDPLDSLTGKTLTGGRINAAKALTLSRNEPPLADPGVDQNVTSGIIVSLDGTSSTDADGTITTYEWAQTDNTGKIASISDPADASPTFIAPTVNAVTLLSFTLTVTDDKGATDSATIQVTIQPNVPPTANAGVDQSVKEGETVKLDGTSSTDADGTISTYSWTQSDNTGIAIELSNPSAGKPTFTAPDIDSATTVSFTLSVTDNNGATSTVDSVSITVNPESSDGGGGGGCFISGTRD